jgi:hypothetical protein
MPAFGRKYETSGKGTFEKTNPILEGQNEHKNIISKGLQRK